MTNRVTPLDDNIYIRVKQKGKIMSNENQNQNENDNQVDERVNVPVNELFGMSVDEWNASQSAWDVLHDQHGLRGLEGRF